MATAKAPRIKEEAAQAFTSPGHRIDDGGEGLKRMIEKDGSELFINRHAVMSNGAQKFVITLFCWPVNEERTGSAYPV
jgi:hypothetical protein